MAVDRAVYSIDADGEASCAVEILSRHDEEERSDGNLTDQETEAGDKKTLLPSEEDVDSDGVVREYEVALKHLGLGFFHILFLFVNGMGLLSDSIEILSISFVLPVFSSPGEFGTSDVQAATLSSSIFMGMLFGSYMWGGLADIIGRRATIICSLTVSALFGFASAFSPWFWLFVMLRFFSGFGVGGSLPVIGPYTSEYVQNKYRGPYLSMQSSFWTFGRLLCGAFAWAIIPVGNIDAPLGSFRFHSWRLFIAVSALPSLIGAFMYFLLPESPRYLLEMGQHEKAMKGLRLAHRLNHLGKGQEYPVKRVSLGNTKKGFFAEGRGSRILSRCKEILGRTMELFHREYWRRTPLLLVILFSLAFTTYGVTMWFPTYVADITGRQDKLKFEKFCDDTFNFSSGVGVEAYCDCSATVFADFTLDNTELRNFRINDVLFSNVSFSGVKFESVVFNGTRFTNCKFLASNFTDSFFNSTVFDGGLFDSVNISSSSLCSVNGSAVQIRDSSVADVEVNGESVARQNFDSSTFNELLSSKPGGHQCSEGEVLREVQCKSLDSRVYRDSFYVSASSLPGNVVSAFGVYFFRRNYWMTFTLFLATISVFLLNMATSEVFVVVMLCVFNGITVTSWNDAGLLMAELYPTHLRSTAAGIHLLMARVGAIIGTNLFGLFIRVNPSVPILLVAVVMFTGCVTALALPKTTRNTLLK